MTRRDRNHRRDPRPAKSSYGDWRQCRSKSRYRSEGEAQQKAKRCMAIRPLPVLRVYDCPVCNGWHITGKPLGN